MTSPRFTAIADLYDKRYPSAGDKIAAEVAYCQQLAERRALIEAQLVMQAMHSVPRRVAADE